MKAMCWKESRGGKYARVNIGALDLRCSVWWTEGKQHWMPTVMFPYNRLMRIGELCSSMAEGKKEALKIAREILEDHYVAVKAEMANFDRET